MPALRERRLPNRRLRATRPPRSARSASPGGPVIGQIPEPPDAEIERAGDVFAALLTPFFVELRRILTAERFDAINSVRASRVRRAVAEAERRYRRRFGAQQRVREAERFVAEVEAQTEAAADRSIQTAGAAPVGGRDAGRSTQASGDLARSIEDLQSDVARQAALIEQLERALATEGRPPDLDAVARIIKDRQIAASNRARNAANIILRRFSADVVQLRMRAAGLLEYEWGPTESAQPRELHERYRGRTFRWDDPPPGGHPGEAFGCKCRPRPVRR